MSASDTAAAQQPQPMEQDTPTSNVPVSVKIEQPPVSTFTTATPMDTSHEINDIASEMFPGCDSHTLTQPVVKLEASLLC